MAFTESYLPELPTTQFMFNAEEVGRDKLDYYSVGTLFSPEEVPAQLLPVGFENFAASPLYWVGNPETVNRELYAKLHDQNVDQTEDAGILPHKGGERSLRVFSTAVGVGYYLEFILTGQRRTGIDVHILPQQTTRTNLYRISAGITYLTEAFRFLLPVKFRINSLIIAFPSEGSMFVQGTGTQVGLGGDI